MQRERGYPARRGPVREKAALLEARSLQGRRKHRHLGTGKQSGRLRGRRGPQEASSMTRAMSGTPGCSPRLPPVTTLDHGPAWVCQSLGERRKANSPPRGYRR